MKIQRNDPCPCGSGSKFKECCGDGSLVGYYVDGDNILLFKRGFAVNQLRRDAPNIAKTFDDLCAGDLDVIDKYATHCSFIIFSGTKRSERDDVEWRSRCGWLLQNACSDVLAALDLARDGFILQPGILVRHVLEVLTAVLCITVDRKHWEDFKINKLRPEKQISTATKVLPIFGQLYGELSGTFAHVRETHGRMHPIAPYPSRQYPPLQANLRMVKIALWLTYVVSELVFYKMSKSLYWRSLGGGSYAYQRTDACKKLEIELFGDELLA